MRLLVWVMVFVACLGDPVVLVMVVIVAVVVVVIVVLTLDCGSCGG